MSEKILKTEPMFEVFRAIDNRIGDLDSLRLRGAAFGAKEPFYSNIQETVRLLEEGKKQIGLIFEKQYE